MTHTRAAGTARRGGCRPVRRHVRLQNADLMARSGKAMFISKSWTQPNEMQPKTQNENRYHPTIDIESGAVFCDCADFSFRKARHNPNVWSPREQLCKHIARALGNLERRGVLPQQNGRFSPACCKCGVLEADNYFEVCDHFGREIPGRWICNFCIEASVEDGTQDYEVEA